MRLFVISAFALLVAAHAAADILPNEVAGTGGLTVSASVRLGPWVRPGAWAVMSITLENDAAPFFGSVHVRSSSAGADRACFSSKRLNFLRGGTTVDVLFTHDGHVFGWRIEVDAASDSGAPRTVFRADASRIMRPLSSGDRYVLAVGTRAFPVPSAAPVGEIRLISSAVETSDLPEVDDAYASCDVIVVEGVLQSAVSPPRAAALRRFVVGGGCLVFVSYRALSSLGPLFVAMREELERHPATEPSGLPSRMESAFGFGRVVAFAAETDDHVWQSDAAAHMIADLCERPVRSLWVDAPAFDVFPPGRPFGIASQRSAAAAVMGAVIVTLAVVLSSSRSRRTAVLSVGVSGLAGVVLILALWLQAAGSVRAVVAIVFSPDGRAQAVLGTYAVSVAQDRGPITIESAASPLRPIGRREGALGAQEFALGRAEDHWRLDVGSPEAGGMVLARSWEATEITEENRRWRERVGAEGTPALATGRDLVGQSPAQRGAAELVTYLVRRMGLQPERTAWQWRDGWPGGLAAPGFDSAPGSGYLVLGPFVDRVEPLSDN
jgi:hypothetical protein